MGIPLCLRALPATVLVVKTTEEITMGSTLTTLVPHAIEALINSHHTQHFIVSCPTFYEILLLTPHITLSHCNNLSPATLLPSFIDETPHNCLKWIDHLSNSL